MRTLVTACALAALGFTSPAAAQAVKIGVTVSMTGPAASLGIPEANTAKLWGNNVGGVPVEIIVLDDGSDTTKGVANTRKLLTDDKVDVMVGSSTTPVSLAMLEVASEQKAPMISLAASAAIVGPMDDKRRWVFKTPQNDRLMADAIADHMKATGVKSVGFIGFNDAYGDGWLNVTTPALKSRGIELVATERYARSDTSVTGPVLKLLAAKPDVVLVAGSGTPAALPQKTLKERGYAGKIYQTHGAANGDFLRVGGKDVEGTILPAGPVLVASQLPDANPIKKVATEYVKKYEGAHGAGSANTFGAHARIQGGAAGRDRRLEGRRLHAGHRHDDEGRPCRPGQARPRHGYDRRRQLEAPAGYRDAVTTRVIPVRSVARWKGIVSRKRESRSP
jgi:branched-chain amino acid transport system substrate-binding protein